MTTATARVVVADDSALMRRIVSNSLTRAGLRVVGTAADGDQALAVCERERPDAMTLDLAMPGLDGLGVLRRLKEIRAQGRPTLPVVVVSAFSPSQGARAVDALAEGAFDLVSKPAVGEGLDEFAESVVSKVRLAAASNANGNGTAHAPAPRRAVPARPAAPAPRPHLRPAGLARAVVIATSTGGPRALADLVPKLPSPLGSGTLIVQHMPAGFTTSLAARLDRSSKLNVREAAGGESLDPGTALLAPGGKHLRLSDDGRARLTDEPEVGGLRPRADLTIKDAARIWGPRLLLVVLTGMGNDGLAGATEVHKRGGRILAESEESCTVYGMPRAVVEAKLVDDVMSLDRLATAIAAEAS
ncbi:MAG TPA: chemotaxis-specific protein-glutamate methyltransferase CheB [Solirubrobacteraceae bacterium]|nr:chemotaxis-specific protein-glutamate methyltransferase CheB [Solirubrobacteraceae bacterium]